MALSEDQKAMLRVLAQREQGYEDLAALMGLSVDEVRAKVRDALDQLEAEGGAAPPLPPEPAPAVPAAPAAPTPPAEPTAAAPKAAPKPTPVAEPAAPKPPSPSRPRPTLPSSTGARTALGAGLLVIVALIVVLLVSGGDGSGDSTTTSANDGAEAVNTSAASGGKDVTQAVLAAVDGSDAEGLAVFGRVKNSLALQVEASGLEPTANGDSYTIWLYESPQKMLPLASTTIDDSGKLAARVEVPTEVLGYLANETFDQLDISLTTDATLKASLAKATREKKAPVYTGTDVLRGPITGPIIGAAKRQSGK
jgi:hypothetical protein